MIVGDLQDISKSYVLFNGAEYAFKRPVEAVDLSFKIYITFKLSFPALTSYVWLFLKTYVYKLEDAKNVNPVLRLAAALDKIKL